MFLDYKTKELIRNAIKEIVEYYDFYYEKQKEFPTKNELIAVLMYQLDVDKWTVYKILNILNYYGILVDEGYRYKLIYKPVVTENNKVAQSEDFSLDPH